MTDHTLTLPAGFVIDELSLLRLEHQLQRAPAHVDAVVAPVGELPPGSSYRVHAERLALQPLNSVTQQSEPPPGALLRRSESAGGSHEGTVGTVLVDEGTHTHDPDLVAGVLDHASPLGRSPFPWRPLVLFLDLQGDPDTAGAAAALADTLLDHDVEGRVASTRPPSGPSLSRPCLPSRESVEALRPDVVVALDRDALDAADPWLAPDRHATVVAWDPELAHPYELVTWHIGEATGRLRARIAPGIEPAELAALIRRLAAGPHPVPPTPAAATDDGLGDRPVPVSVPALRRPQRRRTVVALVGVLETAAAERLDALRGAIDAGGDVLEVRTLGATIPDEAHDAPVLLLRGVTGASVVDELVDVRRDRGLATILDLGPADVDARGGVPVLVPDARRLAGRCGLATTSSAALAATIGRPDTGDDDLDGAVPAVKVLASLLDPGHHSALLRIRAERRRQHDLVGWHVGPGGPVGGDAHDDLAATVQELVDRRPGLRVRVVGDPRRIPTLLHGPRIEIHPGPAHPAETGTWAVQLWTPDAATVDTSGYRRPLVEASCLGVPTMVAEGNPAVADGAVLPELVVVDGSWCPTIERLLDDERTLDRLGGQLERRAEVLYGPAEAVATAQDLLDWAMRTAAS